jgi:hypothetical protein
MTNETAKPPAEIGVFSAASIGIGGMVGAGIFAVLGLAAATTKGAVPIAFVIGGVIALVTAHCYGKLSVAYPDRGGTVAYLDRAFGATAFTGILNVLLVLSYIVMVGFYASAFGRFGASFLGDSELWRHVLMTTVVFALAFVNIVGTGLVVKFGNFATFVKVVLLVAFIVVGLLSGDVDYSRFAMSEWVDPLTLVAGAMVVFLNYEGFEMIANVASDVPEEKRAQVMPRAFYGSVLIVIALYVLISVVAAGTLSPSALVDAGEFALAESAEALIGPLGFKVIAVAALLATSSAINATLFSSARMTFALANEREIPSQLGQLVREQPLPALGFVCLSGTLLANLVDIEVIAAMGSAGFLLAFAAINVASIRLSGAIGLNRWIPVVGTGMCLTAVVVMFTQVGTLELMLFLGMLVSAVLIEIVARSQGRGFTMRRGAH